MRSWQKVVVIAMVSAITLAFHYGWNPIGGGHSHLLHSIHGRLCYIPILLAAGWFGLAGGILGALGISLAVLPYILLHPSLGAHELTTEYTELFFYFALGALSGWLFDRQRQADDQRIRAERKLAQTERLGLLGRMVATVAHEVRNPLGSIRGSVEMLADEIPHESPRREFIDIIQSETRRLETIVDAYLEYSSPKPPQRARGDLATLVRSVSEQFRSGDPALGVRLDIPETMPADFDAGQIRRVLLNLMSNAREAVSSGGKLTVQAEATEAGLVIEVSDTGAGIPSHIKERLFEPFVTSKATGSGLGLSLSREIVEAHGGTLEFVEKGPGQTGSCFRITLPGPGVREVAR